MDALGFVFDLDDTLYPEHDYVRSCFNWVAAQLGDRAISESLLELYQQGEKDPVGVIAARQNVLGDERLALISGMRAHAPAIALDSGARALISRLRAAGKKFSILTNGRSITQRRKIEALGVTDAAAILISEEVGASKPDVSIFRAAAAAHAARDYLYVGDNPAVDFEGPNALGWMTVMLQRKNGVRRPPFEPAPAQRPQRLVTSLDELLPLV